MNLATLRHLMTLPPPAWSAVPKTDGTGWDLIERSGGDEAWMGETLLFEDARFVVLARQFMPRLLAVAISAAEVLDKQEREGNATAATEERLGRALQDLTATLRSIT